VKFQIYKDKKGKYRWRAMSKGRIVADGAQGYACKANLMKSLENFKRMAMYAYVE